MALALQIIGLGKTFTVGPGEVRAVRDFDLDIEEGSFVTLLGPSGCGKTTTLRCIAGLERPEVGEIRFGDDVIVSCERNFFVPPHHREIGMVFQSYAIWPHMTVFENVAFPLRYIRPRLRRPDIRKRVLQALELVALGGYENRPAPLLSGGQQQRLALARALVREPKLLLLDEPLSNLDAKLREDMRSEIVQLTKRLGITTVYVTHDQVEALTMSQKIAIMNEGRLVQVGSPKDVYHAPEHQFVAEFIGSANIITGRPTGKTAPAGLIELETPIGNVLSWAGDTDVEAGQPVVMVIRPEGITLADEAPADSDAASCRVLQGEVTLAVFQGDSTAAQVEVNGYPIRVKVPPRMPIEQGQVVYLVLPATECRVLHTASG